MKGRMMRADKDRSCRSWQETIKPAQRVAEDSEACEAGKSCEAGEARAAGGVNCVVYYSSSTGNTLNFVERLGIPAVRLEKDAAPPLMDRPYVMIMPTYADGEGRGALPKAAIRFLNVKENRALLRGVVAGGNRNFGLLYACAGDVIAYKCGVPCLYRYELRGMPEDIANVRRILADLPRGAKQSPAENGQAAAERQTNGIQAEERG